MGLRVQFRNANFYSIRRSFNTPPSNLELPQRIALRLVSEENALIPPAETGEQKDRGKGNEFEKRRAVA